MRIEKMAFTISIFMLSLMVPQVNASETKSVAGKSSAKSETGFVKLFDGKSLDNWETKSGTAEFKIVDGAIVGTTKKDSPNTFLCTKKQYSDFILEYEYKVDPKMNSGVQIRSATKKLKNGKDRVWGYQIEIDPSDRAWSCGIYEEAGRGWLQPKKGNTESVKAFTTKTKGAFKQNEWNKVRIEAKGDSLKTWLNGVACADLKDGNQQSGFIGLQVHSSKHVGMEIAWRNLKIKELK